MMSADSLDCLPDALLLVIFDKIRDVKALGRCCVVSRRFQTLVRQAHDIAIRVDCIVLDDESAATSSSSSLNSCDGGAFSHLLRFVRGQILKPLHTMTQFFGVPKRARDSMAMYVDDEVSGEATHHSPAQVLKNFNDVKFLQIELPSGELGVNDGVLLKWRGSFGSTLDNCVILGASSVSYPEKTSSQGISTDDGSGVIPESFYTNGDLKLRVVWTISSLIAASARHYLVQPIIDEHKTLESLVLSDMNGQGMLSMDREQLEELRDKPLSVSSSSKRTIVPALTMRLWYKPRLELGDGSVLEGATLVAIRPKEKLVSKEKFSDGGWISGAFEEPYASAAKILVKGRTYSVQMNSF